MSEVTPENIQEKINIYQQMQQQIQALNQQTSQIDISIIETEKTIEEINNAKKNTPIYRAIGSVMKKIDNIENLKQQLEEEKETMEIRNKTLRNQIEKMTKEFLDLQKKIEPLIKEANNSNERRTTQ
tara:strand:+ start:563 stop:943 length:381 start_codon:yes stop_codon:yes gene_type:complete